MGTAKCMLHSTHVPTMSKIRATDDHQEYGDASICLNADETRAFFGTFAQVYEEFHQLIASLPPTYPEPWKEHPPIPGVVLTTATSTVVISSTATSMRSEPRLLTGD